MVANLQMGKKKRFDMKKVKIIAVVLSVIILTGVLAACGSAAIPKPTVSGEVTTVEITGSCDMKVEGNKITVSGETSFMTGTIIYISVVAQSGMELSSAKVAQPQDGKVEAVFEMTDKVYNENVKSITGFITVAPTKYGKQNENVYTEYGKKFELISNDTVWNKDGNIVTFSSDPYEL